MRIPSGKTDQSIYFVALDATDMVTRKTGLSSFSVRRSRNAGTDTAYTTPTVVEISSANQPGVYALLIDEDTTIASTSDSEEYCVHITATGMAPVDRTIELYRRDTTSGATALVDSNGRLDVIKVAGTSQTARDLGASVLLSTAYDAAKTAATQTSVDDLPTNSELATALAGADDAVLAAIAALNNLSAAQVNVEMVDALSVDAYAEPSGVPAATASLAAKLGRLHAALRNGIDVTAAAKTFKDDAGSALWKKALSDDGTTYAEAEAGAP